MTKLTWNFGCRVVGIAHVFGHDHGEPCSEVEVDMTVENPRARVVGREAEGNIVATRSDANYITARWVDVVVCSAARGTNNIENVAVQVERMLKHYVDQISDCQAIGGEDEQGVRYHLRELISR